MALQKWVRLPSKWIRQQGLRALQWDRDGRGADNIAALMTLTAIAHHANAKRGVAKLTYDAMSS